MKGRLFAVVGPSGAGKDTLIDAARAARPDLVIVRRAITRPQSAGGEDFEGISDTTFDARLRAGEFGLWWKANGLRYGIPAASLDLRDIGRDVLFNGSRAALDQAALRFPDLVVIRVTAPSQVLMERLLARGRETREEITARIARSGLDLPAGLQVVDVLNDGPLPKATAAFLAVLQPVSA